MEARGAELKGVVETGEAEERAETDGGGVYKPRRAVKRAGRQEEGRGELFSRAKGIGKSDPVWWMEHILGIELYEKTGEIAEAVRDFDKVTVKSGHGLGKTWIDAAIALWWVFVEDGMAIVTGPSAEQVKSVFWGAGVHAILGRSLFPPAVTRELQPGVEEWEIRPMVGIWTVNSAKETQANVFGRHAPKMLLIVDEASGVPDELFDAFEATQVGKGVAGAKAKMLLTGNPHIQGGCNRFYEANAPDSDFRRIHISAFDSPNITGEKVVPGMVGEEWVGEMKARWGENSLAYQVKVLGEYWKEGASDRLIPESLIINSLQREHPVFLTTPDGKSIRHSCGQGVDYARYGDDEMVSVIVKDGLIVDIANRRGMDEATAGTWIAERHRAFTVLKTTVDTTGLGAGVYDNILAHDGDVDVEGVSFNRKATREERYSNVRTEMAVMVRDALREGWVKLGRDTKQEVFEDLRALRYKTKGTKVALIAKDQIKKELGRSPDFGDAMMLAVRAYLDVRQQTPEEKAYMELLAGVKKFDMGQKRTVSAGYF